MLMHPDESTGMWAQIHERENAFESVFYCARDALIVGWHGNDHSP